MPNRWRVLITSPLPTLNISRIELDDLRDRSAIVSLAVYFGEMRFIDNLILNDMKFKARAGIRLGEAKM